MDNTQTTDCVEFCFGYGGNHLGLKRIIRNLRCIAASEIEAYACANMVAKMEAGFMDPFPVWTDLRTFPCEQFRGLVDIFIASYPCQPFSSAGQRKGADDPRHLWPFVRRAVEIIRPRYCFFENVEGHVSLGLREVLTELALLGYRVENSRGEPTWGIFSAAECGAPHNRKRVFILAEDGQVDNTLREQNDWHNTVRLHRSFMRASQELAVTNTGGHIHEQSSIESAEGRLDAQRDLAAGCGKVKELGDTSIIRRPAVREGTGEDCIGEETRQDGRVREPSGASPFPGDGLHAQGLEKPERSGGGASRPDEIASGQSGQPCEPSVAKSSRIRERESNHSQRAKSRKDARKNAGRRSPHAGVGLADSGIARPQGRKCEELQECSSEQSAWTQSPLHWPGFVARPNEPQKPFEPPRIIGVKRGLGGGVNGRALSVDEYRRRVLNEKLPNLQSTDSQQGQEPSEVLQPGMLRNLADAGESVQADNSKESTTRESSDGDVREMRCDGKSSTSPSGLQQANRGGDSLQRLSLEDSWRREFNKGDGKAHNVDRLRLLGNGVYPAAAAKAFFTLYKRLIT